MAKKKLLVKCPGCKEKFDYYDSKFRPFCSNRCQQVDLGKWFAEDYSIEGEHRPPEHEEYSDED